jgi:O-antigen ligase
MVLALIGVFEFGKKWLLYSALTNSLGLQRSIFDIYLLRGESGSLRAQGSTGQPIPFGYVMAVATGFFLYLKNAVPKTTARNLGFALLMAGLVAGLSRGPWIGAAVIVLVFIATGPAPVAGLSKLAGAGAVSLALLITSPIGNQIIDLMPFVGTVDEFNVTYRQRLLEISIEVIKQNPVFGSADAMSSPMMQELVQGQGMIDLVNSYLGVALATGLAGLILFSGIFIAVGIALLNAIQKQKRGRFDDDFLGRALFSTLVGILVMIFTVSSISVIPVIYWAIAGMGVAYLNMLNTREALASVSSAKSAPPSVRPNMTGARQDPLSAPSRISKR